VDYFTKHFYVDGKKKEIRWARHVVLINETRNENKVLCEYFKEGDRLKDISVHGKTTLKQLFMK